jgi:hypothetical protein
MPVKPPFRSENAIALLFIVLIIVTIAGYFACDHNRSKHSDDSQIGIPASQFRDALEEGGNEENNGISAEITSTWVDYNFKQGGQQGIRVHCNFSIEGMQNKKCIFEVRTNIESVGSRIKSETFSPSYESSEFTDYTLFIPYSDLGLEYFDLNYDAECMVSITDGKTMKPIISGDYKKFSFYYVNDNPGEALPYEYLDNYSDQNTDQSTSKIPTRSEWQNMIYIDHIFVSHYAGQTHSVNIYLYKRPEYKDVKCKIYFQVQCYNSDIDFEDRTQFEDVFRNTETESVMLDYSNPSKPVVTLSDFSVRVTNVVME